MPEGDGSVLDQSLLLYGGGMGDGNMHRHSDLPTLMAGGLGGRFKMGRHHQYKLDTPMANLLLTIMDSGGVRLPLTPAGPRPWARLHLGAVARNPSSWAFIARRNAGRFSQRVL